MKQKIRLYFYHEGIKYFDSSQISDITPSAFHRYFAHDENLLGVFRYSTSNYESKETLLKPYI